MVSSRTLRRFVQMHEDKLNAKMHGERTNRQDAELEVVHTKLTGSHDTNLDADHWSSTHSNHSTRNRPHSRYFNFILTSNH